MADQPSVKRHRPTLGQIVLYTSRHGDLDMPAIVTGHVTDAPADADAVHLTLFPPPGAQRDVLSHEFGVSRADEPQAGYWRWPERAS